MGSVLPFARVSASSGADDTTRAREVTLVGRARSGDVEAWALLYREHFDQLFNRIVYFTGGDVQTTEDLIQDAFARAFIGLQNFESRSSFSGWLHGIAINVVRKHWRSRHRGDQALHSLESMSREPATPAWADPESAHLHQRRAAVLFAVLETLPASLREAFVLCDFEEMPVRDAAAQLGISPTNLRVRATRARARIRSELIRLGWLPEEKTTRPEERDHVDE